MMMIKVIIIIAFKVVFRDFYSLLAAPRTVSNTNAQVAKAQWCENHVQHIERLSRATCVPLGTKGQLRFKCQVSLSCSHCHGKRGPDFNCIQHVVSVRHGLTLSLVNKPWIHTFDCLLVGHRSNVDTR